MKPRVMKVKRINLVLSVLVLFTLSLIVLLNRAYFEQASVIDPAGVKKNISIPFDSQENGSEGLYIYDVRFHNSILFSGKLHIRPDDCIKEIKLNGNQLTAEQYPIGNCDCINGFYLDLKSLLKSGENHLQLKIQNTKGFFGLKIDDTTSYEKYIVVGFLLFLLCRIRYKLSFRWTAAKLNAFYSAHRTILQILCTLGLIFFLTLLASLFIEPLSQWFWPLVIQVILIISMPIGYWILRNFAFGKWILTVWIGMVLLFLCHLVGLSHRLFSYDYQGHIDYINYLVTYGEAPVSDGGWSFYHPSLYYRFASVIWAVFDLNNHMTEDDFLKSSQASSLLTFILYCYFSLKTVHLFFGRLNKSIDSRTKDRVQLFVTIVFLCWPSNSIVAVRVGNDVLFDLLFALSFYFCLKWYHTEKSHHLLLALLFATLDVWAKTNGLIMFGIIGSLMVFRYIRSHSKLEYGATFLMFALFSLITLYYCFHEKLEQYISDSTTHLVVGNASGLSENLRVGAGLRNYTSFDIVSFVGTPFTSSFDDALGRNSFWFYLFKSSLFGEFTFNSPGLELSAQVLSFLFLIIFAFAIFGTLTAIDRLSDHIPLFVNIGFMLSSMIVFRIYLPFSCASDFRYIYPAILPALLFMGMGLSQTYMRNLWYSIGKTICIAFVSISVIFQLLTILHYANA